MLVLIGLAAVLLALVVALAIMVAPRPDPRPAGLGPTPPNTLIGFSCPACGYLLPAQARPAGTRTAMRRLDSQNRQAARADPDAGPLHTLSHPGSSPDVEYVVPYGWALGKRTSACFRSIPFALLSRELDGCCGTRAAFHDQTITHGVMAPIEGTG